MVRKHQEQQVPANNEEKGNVRMQLALKSAMTSPKSALFDTDTFNIVEKEVECARRFNFRLPAEPTDAVIRLEEAVASVTRMRKNVILLFNDEQGTYSCLNDEVNPQQKPRELTRISDGFLRELLEAEDTLHTYLFSDDQLIGILAVADPRDHDSFDVYDEILLELAGKYLSTKILSFRQMKQGLNLTRIQETVLEISGKLITAVDQEGVLSSSLEALAGKLNFGVAQYIRLDARSGEGEVMVEYRDGKTRSYLHAGLQSKRKNIEGYASLVSLFSSVARSQPYLHIPGGQLGDKPLNEIFDLKGKDTEIHSALILPVTDPATGQIQGTINLYRTSWPVHIAPETLEMAKEVTQMVSLALTRVTVLEKALAMASTDELTGLTNRRGFYDRFEAEIERARRNQTSLSVAMIDVDFFKKLNDTFGHLNGDIVLRELASLFRSSLRRSDMVCRFGGEEFAILLPETSYKTAEDLLERIRKKVCSTEIRGMDGEDLATSISVGLAPVSTSSHLGTPTREIISDALATADEQLYRAKEEGRNRICAAGA